MAWQRTYTLLEPSPADIRARLVAVERELVSRAIAKGIIRSAGEARIRDLEGEDLGLDTEVFVHSVTAANTWEKYYDGTKRIDAVTIGDMIICIVGMYNDAADPKSIKVRYSVGVPLRPILEVSFQPVYVQDQPKLLLTKDVWFEKGDKATIEVYARATGADGLAFLGLVCEKA